MKKLFIILFLFNTQLVFAQQYNPDSQKQLLKTETSDSVLFKINSQLYGYYEERNYDSALFYANQELMIARKDDQKIPEGLALTSKSYQLINMSKYGESLKCLTDAFKILEDPESEIHTTWLTVYLDSFSISQHNNRLWILSVTHHMYALLMDATLNYKEEIFHLKEEIRISEMCGRNTGVQLAYMNLARVYKNYNKLDTALIYAKKTLSLSEKNNYKKYDGWVLRTLGDIYLKMNEDSLALKSYLAGVTNSIAEKDLGSLEANYGQIASFYLDKKNRDSSLYYAKKSLSVARGLGTAENIKSYLAIAYQNLYKAYKLNNQPDSTFKYLQIAMTTKDSVYNHEIKNLADFQSLTLSHEQQLQELETEKIATQNKIRLYILIAALIVFIIIALLLNRNNRNKKKANRILQSQKEEIEVQKKNVEETLAELKSTQSQLIQSEKMASLGELTAGIAHEIQNPLNFVNNFSEVNAELIDELTAEVDKGDMDEVKVIAKDIKENEEKINHHGKRADAIVKGMLQHSRSSTGAKEPTDINALADEYLRLTYQGLRAKDKGFNAELKTDFDENIGKINIIPQDIGRVLLNLYNNAFYACAERSRSTVNAHLNESRQNESFGLAFGQEQKSKNPDLYQPTVWVSTKKEGDRVVITVKDNGGGIPEKIKEKIFQPFFTTKPTGSGTGLGLSLSYDIVKAHGGEIKVESKEGEGSEFIIQLSD